MLKRVLLTTISLMFFSCATTKTLTPYQQSQYEKIRYQPTTVSVPNDRFQEAWGRAQSFLARYSSMKMQTVTDYVLDTYNPLKNSTGTTNMFVAYGYSVSRMLSGGGTNLISVKCVSNNMFANEYAKRNAQILAHYIETGELIDESLIEY